MRSRRTNIEGAGCVEPPRASVEPVVPLAGARSSAERAVEGQPAELAPAANPAVNSPGAGRFVPEPQAAPQSGQAAPSSGVTAPGAAAPLPPASRFDDDEWEW
jgi:hypothetical protein